MVDKMESSERLGASYAMEETSSTGTFGDRGKDPEARAGASETEAQGNPSHNHTTHSSLLVAECHSPPPLSSATNPPPRDSHPTPTSNTVPTTDTALIPLTETVEAIRAVPTGSATHTDADAEDIVAAASAAATASAAQSTRSTTNNSSTSSSAFLHPNNNNNNTNNRSVTGIPRYTTTPILPSTATATAAHVTATTIKDRDPDGSDISAMTDMLSLDEPSASLSPLLLGEEEETAEEATTTSTVATTLEKSSQRQQQQQQQQQQQRYAFVEEQPDSNNEDYENDTTDIPKQVVMVPSATTTPTPAANNESSAPFTPSTADVAPPTEQADSSPAETMDGSTLNTQNATSNATTAMNDDDNNSNNNNNTVSQNTNQQQQIENNVKLNNEEDQAALDDAYIRSPEVQNAIVERSPGGRYVRFMEKLGSGASKDVYRAYDTQEGIEVAWNVVNLSGVPKAERNRIVNEVRLLERLHHQNIISFHGSWVNRERQEVNFVTEILSSGTLKSFINKVQVIRWKIAKRWALQILMGLEYLHSQDPPVIHRDLKCENIFINGTSGDLRIGDLGLSTVHRNGKVLSVLGTPEFMAPDMYEENSYNEKVDVYAFGMCLLEIFTKEIPYAECSNPAQIYKKVSAGEPPEVLERLQSKHAREFVMLCLGYRDEHGNFIRPTVAELLQHPFLVKRSNDDDEVVVDRPLRERAITETSHESFNGTPIIQRKIVANNTPQQQQQPPQQPLPPNGSENATHTTGIDSTPMATRKFPSAASATASKFSKEEEDGDRFEEMQESEISMRKVKVLMGRGQELKEEDEEVDNDDVAENNAVDTNRQTEVTHEEYSTVSRVPYPPTQPPSTPVQTSRQQEQQSPGRQPPPDESSAFQYLVASAIVEDENLNVRPHADDILKLVVTLPVDGQTQNVQFDFHLVEDDPVQVAKEMVKELDIPQGAVLEISETISALARTARMKQDKYAVRFQGTQSQMIHSFQTNVQTMQPHSLQQFHPTGSLASSQHDVIHYHQDNVSNSHYQQQGLHASHQISTANGPSEQDLFNYQQGLSQPIQQGQHQSQQQRNLLFQTEQSQLVHPNVHHAHAPSQRLFQNGVHHAELPQNSMNVQPNVFQGQQISNSEPLVNAVRPENVHIQQGPHPTPHGQQVGQGAVAGNADFLVYPNEGVQPLVQQYATQMKAQANTVELSGTQYQSGVSQEMQQIRSSPQTNVMKDNSSVIQPVQALQVPESQASNGSTSVNVESSSAQHVVHVAHRQPTQIDATCIQTPTTTYALPTNHPATQGGNVSQPTQNVVMQTFPTEPPSQRNQISNNGFMKPQTFDVSTARDQGILPDRSSQSPIVSHRPNSVGTTPVSGAVSTDSTRYDELDIASDMDSDSDDIYDELRKLDDDYQKNLERAKKVFVNRMDNLQRSQIEREAQHLKTLEKHEKERAEFEKRLAQEAEQQHRRIEQLQREWDKRRESVALHKRKAPKDISTVIAGEPNPDVMPMYSGSIQANHFRTASSASSNFSNSPNVSLHKLPQDPSGDGAHSER